MNIRRLPPALKAIWSSSSTGDFMRLLLARWNHYSLSIPLGGARYLNQKEKLHSIVEVG